MHSTAKHHEVTRPFAARTAVTVAALIMATALSGCSQKDDQVPSPTPSVSSDTTTRAAGDDIYAGGELLSKDPTLRATQLEALELFNVVAVDVIGKALQTSADGSSGLTAAGLEMAVSGEGVEGQSSWQVLTDREDVVLALLVPLVGVCGVVIDPAWVSPPSKEQVKARTICAGPGAAGVTDKPETD